MTTTTNFIKAKPSLLDLVQSSSQVTPATPQEREPKSVGPDSAPLTTLRDDLTWNWPEFARLMEAAGYTTKTALAQAAGMQRQEFLRIKSGQCAPTTYTIAKLCRVLKCGPGDFLSYEDST